ncbi:MAG: hypothetical protein KDA42_15730 [Planctomycetales bacterium]|nr:hypothetical protein [Planctomycetales bacterium]
MTQRFSTRRVAAVVALVVLIAGGVAWRYSLLPGRTAAPSNALIILKPYRYGGTWVFDDANVGLVREPFVAGVPEMIDHLVADIPNSDTGFRMVVCPRPFPGYQKKLTWLRGDGFGNWYRLDDPPMEGWICPAMFRYYSEAPDELYVMAEAIEVDTSSQTDNQDRAGTTNRP